MKGEGLRVAISDWIMVHALAGANEVEVLAGICGQMNDARVPILRASVAHDLLDPTFDARGVRWQRDHGALDEAFPRSDDPLQKQEWTRSPFFRLLESREPMLRWRLDATYRRGEFPMLDRFQDEGAVDYVAFASRIGHATAHVGLHGADDESHGAHVDPHVPRKRRRGTCARGQHRPRTRRTDTRCRVVQRPRRLYSSLGYVKPGHGARTPERLRRGAGRGDRGAGRTCAEVHRRRHPGHLPAAGDGAGVGELLYGNLGSPRRLDFTVLGRAVNEAARIESFCASLEQAVIVSTAFAEASGQARSRLVSVGRYAMKGIARPQELFTLDVAHSFAEP